MNDLKLYDLMECNRCHGLSIWTPDNEYWETPLWEGGRVCDQCFTELATIAYPNAIWDNIDR